MRLQSVNVCNAAQKPAIKHHSQAFPHLRYASSQQASRLEDIAYEDLNFSYFYNKPFGFSVYRKIPGSRQFERMKAGFDIRKGQQALMVADEHKAHNEVDSERKALLKAKRSFKKAFDRASPVSFC